jgi:hypothetical protein
VAVHGLALGRVCAGTGYGHAVYCSIRNQHWVAAVGSTLSPVSRWGPDGPPPEAYSRITDPQRFRPLHAATETLLGELDSSFDVERTDGYGLDEELEVTALARPTVMLIPREARAAPLVVAFTTFPGIRLRAGHWCTEGFPSCGCDACSETADDEALRLREMVDNVVAGRFREVISVPLIGDGWQEWEMWSDRGRRRSRSRITGKRARAMVASAGRPSIQWAAWARRL